MTQDKTRADLKKLFKDFSQDSEIMASGIFNYFYKHSVLSSYEKWRLARFLFDDILKFTIFDQPMEKVNWEIPFIYNKYYCSVAHQKFGFRVYVAEKNSKKAEIIAKEIEGIVEKGIKLSEPIVKEYAIKSLERGDVSMDNRLRDLIKVYEYFRDEVLLRKKKIKGVSISLTSPGSSLDDLQKELELRKEISYLEQAGYVSFFSLLEHLCILTLSFRNIPERNKVKDFAQKNWQDKFRAVFDINQAEFKESYDYLLGVSRYKRNPSVHGLFDKLHSIFYFYLPSARHRISIGLYDKEVLLRWRDEELNFNKLDEFLKLLSKHKSTKRIWKYLNEGFNVVFGKNAENLDIFSSEKEFKDFLEYQVGQYDDMANMDW